MLFSTEKQNRSLNDKNRTKDKGTQNIMITKPVFLVDQTSVAQIKQRPPFS